MKNLGGNHKFESTKVRMIKVRKDRNWNKWSKLHMIEITYMVESNTDQNHICSKWYKMKIIDEISKLVFYFYYFMNYFYEATREISRLHWLCKLV